MPKELTGIADYLKEWLYPAQGVLALGVKSIKSGEEFYQHPEVEFPAASIIKIPLVIELFRQAQAGKIDLDEKLELKEAEKYLGAGLLRFLEEGKMFSLTELAWLTMIVSDNTATNLLINRLGMRQVNRFIKSLGFTHTRLKRRMMVHPRGHRVENFICASEITQMLYLLLKGKLLNRQYTEQMIEIFNQQQFQEKIPRYLPVASGNKTGEITGIRHDAAIVHFKENPYVLTIFTQNFTSGAQADDWIAGTSLAVYNYFLERKC